MSEADTSPAASQRRRSLGIEGAYLGRNGGIWRKVRDITAPGHGKPGGVSAVSIVTDDVRTGALRRIPHTDDGAVLALLATGSGVLPHLMDVVADAEGHTAIVTSWEPGFPNSQSDALALLDRGGWLAPSDALRILAPLGGLLDRVADHDIVPLELAPDHLIRNQSTVKLVGFSRHACGPGRGMAPVAGRSPANRRLLEGIDLSPDAGWAEWRTAQIEVLRRLLAWLTSGIGPHASRPGTTGRELMTAAGFTTAVDLQPGNLEDDLTAAAEAEELAAGEKALADAPAIVVHDVAANDLGHDAMLMKRFLGMTVDGTVVGVEPFQLFISFNICGDEWVGVVPSRKAGFGVNVDLREYAWPGLRYRCKFEKIADERERRFEARIVDTSSVKDLSNEPPLFRFAPYAIREGLIAEHGPGVIAIAGISTIPGSPRSDRFANSGWLVVNPNKLRDTVNAARTKAAHARIVAAGPSFLDKDDEVDRVLHPLLAPLILGRERVSQGEELPVPEIDGRPWLDLPYVDSIDRFREEVLGGVDDDDLLARTFPSGWAFALDESAFSDAVEHDRDSLAARLARIGATFTDDTDLSITIGRALADGDNPDSVVATALTAANLLRELPPQTAVRRAIVRAYLDNAPGIPDDPVERIEITHAVTPVAGSVATSWNEDLEATLDVRGGLARIALYGRILRADPTADPDDVFSAVKVLEDGLLPLLRDLAADVQADLVRRAAADPAVADALVRVANDPDGDLAPTLSAAEWDRLIDMEPDRLEEYGVARCLTDTFWDDQAVRKLAAQAGTTARHTMRELRTLDAVGRTTVATHRSLAAEWMRSTGGLDLAPEIISMPDALDILEQVGVESARAMAATGVGLDTVLRLRPVSEAIEVPLSDVVRALSTVGELEVPVPPTVNGPAESLWLRSRLDAVEPRDAAAVLAASLHELDTDPGVVVKWALYGDRLVDRVLETALGADPLRALGLDGTFRAAGAERLMLDPPLASALQRLPDPTTRVRALEIALPLRDPSLAGLDLEVVVASTQPVDLVTNSIITGLDAATVARLTAAGFLPSRRADIMLLGPLAARLGDESIRALLQISAAGDTRSMLQAAIVEQTRPGTAALLAAYGTQYLAWLAGSSGPRVAGVLGVAAARPEFEWWLLNGGADAVDALERHGDRLLQLAIRVRAPVTEVRLLAAVLDAVGDAAGADADADWLAMFAVRNGVQPGYWTTALKAHRRGRSDGAVLARLWAARRLPGAAGRREVATVT